MLYLGHFSSPKSVQTNRKSTSSLLRAAFGIGQSQREPQHIDGSISQGRSLKNFLSLIGLVHYTCYKASFNGNEYITGVASSKRFSKKVA